MWRDFLHVGSSLFLPLPSLEDFLEIGEFPPRSDDDTNLVTMVGGFRLLSRGRVEVPEFDNEIDGRPVSADSFRIERMHWDGVDRGDHVAYVNTLMRCFSCRVPKRYRGFIRPRLRKSPDRVFWRSQGKSRG